MTPTTLRLFAFFLILLLSSIGVYPQTHGGGGKANIKEGLGSTWKGPSSGLIKGLLKNKTSGGTTSAGGRRTLRAAPVPVPTGSVIFRPGASSGVDQALATAFASTPAEKQGLIELFKQVRLGYETEVAKEGKSNNLAAAMTFFIASNVVAYHRTEMPSDEATENLFVSLRDLMSSTPEISKMTNAEKQQMHDWLVYMGGFVLAGYIEAQKTNDRESLDSFKQIAEQSTKIVLGIDISTLTITKNGLSVSSGGMADSFLRQDLDLIPHADHATGIFGDQVLAEHYIAVSIPVCGKSF